MSPRHDKQAAVDVLTGVVRGVVPHRVDEDVGAAELVECKKPGAWCACLDRQGCFLNSGESWNLRLSSQQGG